jgi:hypothetical protein
VRTRQKAARRSTRTLNGSKGRALSLLPNSDRVRIWNTFLAEARASSKTLFDLTNGTVSKDTFTLLGGTLSDQNRAILLALIHCTLAIEARANHLIDELVERGRLTEDEANAIQRLQPQQKWFLLPKLYGSKVKLRSDRAPHQAIAEICSRRNSLVHVNFRRLKDKLPDGKRMLKLFEQLVDAVADMNVVLRRTRRVQKHLTRIGRF